LGSRRSIFLAVEGNKGKALASVINISYHTELLELGLEIAIGHVLVNPINEEFASLFSHDDTIDDVWILEEIDSIQKRF